MKASEPVRLRKLGDDKDKANQQGVSHQNRKYICNKIIKYVENRISTLTLRISFDLCHYVSPCAPFLLIILPNIFL
eukprot:m.253769 g.253769  ORF g.253769 m.253769 type:complete len:76 (+) comp16164_c0_seq22:615-842(+)